MLGRHQTYDKAKTDLTWQHEVLNGLYNELKLTNEDKGNLFEDELQVPLEGEVETDKAGVGLSQL